ncbi:MAG: ChbG/HpnK family deacetylase [Elusimicrobiota bacterium]|jgi:predicted glycoside hydrolase/deacetylase ChbG (UPF0249 family)|nr:ChbG/HpnK family deacetylase [Elusimicrobiota bacterium]
MLKLLLNADDYGFSTISTDNINRCLDEGLINGVSIMAGGADIERAVESLKNRKAAITIHLHLFDGHCLADKRFIPDLINSDEKFKFNLLSLWYALNMSSKREKIKEQVFVEFCSQIDFVLKHFPNIPIRIDGHQHIHCMPVLKSVIKKLIGKYKISYIRTPIENDYPFKAPFIKKSKSLLRRYLLKKWGFSIKSILDKYNVATADYFIGSALSTDMKFDYLSAILNKLSDKSGLAEIMLHPGYENDFNLILSRSFRNLIDDNKFIGAF